MAAVFCANLCTPDAVSFRNTGETLELPLASFASFAVQSLWKYTKVFHDLWCGLPLMRVSKSIRHEIHMNYRH